FVPVVVDGVVYVAAGQWVFAIGGSGEAVTASSATPEPSGQTTPTTQSAATAATGAAAGEPVAFGWSNSGDGRRELLFPESVAVDAHGQIWVTSMPGSFYIFDLDGNLLETWGTSGTGNGQFNFSDPSQGAEVGAILFSPDGGFYVADIINFRIQQFDRD